MTTSANSIVTSTGVVTIDPTPPLIGQVLTATSPTTAKWKNPTGGTGTNIPEDWLALPTVLPTENKFVGLFAVRPEGADVVINFTGTDTIVDWGDGTASASITGSYTASHSYSYASLPVASECSLGYRQVIITITATNLTSLDLSLKPTGLTTLMMFDSCFLDIAMSFPNMTNLVVGQSGSATTFFKLRRFSLLNSQISSISYMFANMYSLEYIGALVTSTLTNVARAFQNCAKLRAVPEFNTASATSVEGLFFGCAALENLPASMDLSSATTISNMFYGCSSLTLIPDLTLRSSGTLSASNFIYSCSNLLRIPTIANFSNVTNLGSFAAGCPSIKSIPALDCSNMTDTSTINLGSSVTENLAYGFKNTGGVSITYNNLNKSNIELFLKNLGIVGSATISITGCTGTGTIYTNSCTYTAGSNVVTMSSTTGLSVGMFAKGVSLAPANLFNLPVNSNVITETAHGLANGQAVIRSNSETIYYVVNATANTFSISTSIGGSVFSITSALLYLHGDLCTFSSTNNKITRASHGFVEGMPVSFLAGYTAMGIIQKKVYYVKNVTTNTFEISDTVGGATITLAGSGDGYISYLPWITAINSSTSVTLSSPCLTSGTGNIAFRTLDTSHALLKGWTVSG